MDITDIRRENLRHLIDKEPFNSSRAEFAKAVDTDPNYLSQLLSHTKPVPMGRSLARQIEVALGKPKGWMDQQHYNVVPVDFSREKLDPALLAGALEAVDSYFEEFREIPITSRQKATLTKLLVEHFSGQKQAPTPADYRAKIADISPLFTGRG